MAGSTSWRTPTVAEGDIFTRTSYVLFYKHGLPGLPSGNLWSELLPRWDGLVENDQFWRRVPDVIDLSQASRAVAASPEPRTREQLREELRAQLKSLKA